MTVRATTCSDGIFYCSDGSYVSTDDNGNPCLLVPRGSPPPTSIPFITGPPPSSEFLT
jgi:hypothetical protein